VIQHCESWDSIRTTTALGQVYSSVVTSAATSWVAGDVRGFAIKHTQSETATTWTDLFAEPNASDEYFIGFRLKADENSSNATHILCQLFDGVTEQFQVRLRSNVGATSLNIQLLRNSGSAIGGAVSSDLPPNVTVYVEIYVKLSNTTTGAWEIRLNGVTNVSATGVSTSASGNKKADRVTWTLDTSAIAGTYTQIKDILVLDGLAGERTDFQGDVILEDRVPDAVGFEDDWVPLAGQNYENIDDALVADEDSSYNSSAVATDVDLVGYSDLAYVAGQIIGVVLRARARNDAAGTTSLRQLFRDPNLLANAAGATVSLTAQTYAPVRQVWERNPVTGDDWLVSDRAQFGYERVT